MFDDSISVGGKTRHRNKVVFKPYIGIAPSQYRHLFKMDKRRKDGRAHWMGSLESEPRNWRPLEPVGEQASLDVFDELLKKRRLSYRRSPGHHRSGRA